MHIKTSHFLPKLSLFSKHRESTNLPNLAWKVLETVSAAKQKFYIRNQNELKLTKNPDCSAFRETVEKTYCHFLQHNFFLFKLMLHVVVAFQRYQIYWLWYNI